MKYYFETKLKGKRMLKFYEIFELLKGRSFLLFYFFFIYFSFISLCTAHLFFADSSCLIFFSEIDLSTGTYERSNARVYATIHG